MSPSLLTDSQTDVPEAHKPHTIEILVNSKPVTVPHTVTGAGILAAAGVPPDFTLFQVEGRKEIPIPLDEELHVHHHEKFIASPTLDPAFVTHPEHASAIETVREAFPGHRVDAEVNADGETTITVRAVDIGAGWNGTELDLTVKLQVTFPSTQPYPFYGPPGLTRTDGRSISHLQPQVELDGSQRSQISLSKHWDPAVETLGARLTAVVAWLRNPR
jgi:hypothetical protein